MGAARWPNYELGWGGFGGVDRDTAKMDVVMAPVTEAALSCMKPTELQIIRHAEISKS